MAVQAMVHLTDGHGRDLFIRPGTVTAVCASPENPTEESAVHLNTGTWFVVKGTPDHVARRITAVHK